MSLYGLTSEMIAKIRAAGQARRTWEEGSIYYTKSEAEARHVPDLRR